jgi:hypothetical protein
MNKFIVVLLVLVVVFALPVLAADPPSLGNSGSPDPIPVDGGASFLAASGMYYGIKRLRAKKAAKKA